MEEYLDKQFLTKRKVLFQWAKCGDGAFSAIPTFLWAAGSAALAHKVLSTLFRRSLFRRVPLWEAIMQDLLFIWMVIYSLHFWAILVKLIRIFVDFCYDNGEIVVLTNEEMATRKIMKQWVIWMCGAIPMATFVHTRAKPEPPPLMIWITHNQWQRREMGPYGYYLSRPVSELHPQNFIRMRHQAIALRRAFSDSRIVAKPAYRKRRHSKSI